jgi:hypothetical protein
MAIPNDAGEQTAKGQPPEAERIKPDAGHSYGSESESVNDQFKQMDANEEIAHLRAEVQQLKNRLSAVEAALADMKK